MATKQKYLPWLATGEYIGCIGLTEPNYGSDPASMVARARSVDEGSRLTSNKMWIYNSSFADVFVVWTKDEEGAIRGFVLEKGRKGCVAFFIGRMILLPLCVLPQALRFCQSGFYMVPSSARGER